MIFKPCLTVQSLVYYDLFVKYSDTRLSSNGIFSIPFSPLKFLNQYTIELFCAVATVKTETLHGVH